MVNLLTYPHFILLFLRMRLLNMTSRFPPLQGGVLDEQVDLMRRAQLVLRQTPLDQSTPAQARLVFHNSVRMLKCFGGIFEKVASIRNFDIPGPAGAIPVRLYLPAKDRNCPLFVLLHGGGWVIGSLETADIMARFICKHAACAVLSVDYRLAPEHPFPSAVDDSFAAVEWAAAHAAELGGDPNRLLVGGDSAGGTLSAVVAQTAHQNGAPRLAGQVLFYPGLNSASLDTPSFKEFGERSLGLTRRDVDWFLAQYTPDSRDRLDPRVSPLLAEDFRGLPPTLLVTAEFDVLRDEGETYAERLQQSGVRVKLMRCNGMTHGFLSTIGLIRRATQYFDQVAAEIRSLAAA